MTLMSRSSRSSATLLLSLILCCVCSAPAALAEGAEGWSSGPQDRPISDGSSIVESLWTKRVGPTDGTTSEPDRIQVHRYRARPAVGEQPEPAAGKGPALLYLPGTNMNGEAALTDERHNLWLFLAARGIEVFTLDYRTHFISNQELEDSSRMKHWGLERFVADARKAAQLALGMGGHDQLFIAGFSRGVTLAYALAGSLPSEQVAGIVALDGSFKSHAPRGKRTVAGGLAALTRSGGYASDVSGSLGWEKRDNLMRAAGTDPSGPALGSDHQSVGEQVADILYTAWGPGRLANPNSISDVSVLARLLATYDRYYPAVQNPEGAALADHEDDPSSPLDDRWGEIDAPVIYFGAANLGADWLLNGIHSASACCSGDPEIHVLESYGHLDVLVGEPAPEDVFEPVVRFIRRNS